MCAAVALQTSPPDLLHFTQRNFVLCPVVEFGRSGRLMSSHLLGVLQPAVVFQVNGDACCSPGVTSDGGEKARRWHCRFVWRDRRTASRGRPKFFILMFTSGHDNPTLKREKRWQRN